MIEKRRLNTQKILRYFIKINQKRSSKQLSIISLRRLLSALTSLPILRLENEAYANLEPNKHKKEQGKGIIVGQNFDT